MFLQRRHQTRAGSSLQRQSVFRKLLDSYFRNESMLMP